MIHFSTKFDRVRQKGRKCGPEEKIQAFSSRKKLGIPTIFDSLDAPEPGLRLSAFAEDQVAKGHRNADTVDQGHTGKGELGMQSVDETNGERADHAAQGFGGIIEAHDQIFLGRICLVSHHILQHRNADGIAGIDQDAAADEQPNLRYQQGAECSCGTYDH